MASCVPLGICSWNYRLIHEDVCALLKFDVFGEQGSLEIGDSKYDVLKHGMLSGRWSLNDSTGVVLEARKAGPLCRTFELTGAAGSWNLRAFSMFGRSMVLTGDQTDCRLVPVHCFTRRATIQGGFRDFRLVAFAFWLTALTWRRQHGAAASS